MPPEALCGKALTEEPLFSFSGLVELADASVQSKTTVGRRINQTIIPAEFRLAFD